MASTTSTEFPVLIDERDHEIGSLRKLVRDQRAEISRLRALGLEACDLAAPYADDAREYGSPSPRIDEIRKEHDRG